MSIIRRTLDVDIKASRIGLFCGGGKFFYLLIFSHQISVDLRQDMGVGVGGFGEGADSQQQPLSFHFSEHLERGAKKSRLARNIRLF